MPCPVTVGFFHRLEHGPQLETRNTSFEFIVDSLGSFPELRRDATLEPQQVEGVYAHRAQYAIQTTVAKLLVRAPQLLQPLTLAKSAEELRSIAHEAREEVSDLLYVSKVKKQGGGENAHKLADRLVVAGGLEALEKEIDAWLAQDFKAVGVALGDAFHSLSMPSDFSLKLGRALLAIKG